MFKYGPREPQIVLSRIRMGCSALNGHLHHFLKVLDKPDCMCGFQSESPSHYFFHCHMYAAQRQTLINVIGNITELNINVVLFGDKSCSKLENESIITAVYNYVLCSKRFNLKNEVY